MQADWWYKFYVAHYRADTGHLTMEQHGIYRALIDHYMETQKGLRDHPLALANAARCPQEVLERNWPVLRGFFVLDHGLLKLKRCEFLISGNVARHDKKSVSGTNGGLRKAEKTKSSQSRTVLNEVENKQPPVNTSGSGTRQEAVVPEEKREEEKRQESVKDSERDVSRLESESYFLRVWEAYPAWSGKEGGYSRGVVYKGSRKKAFEKFCVLLKKEKDYERFTQEIIHACYCYAAFLEHEQWRASCHLVTWLNQERWKTDYAITGAGGGSHGDAIAEGFRGALHDLGRKG